MKFSDIDIVYNNHENGAIDLSTALKTKLNTFDYEPKTVLLAVGTLTASMEYILNGVCNIYYTKNAFRELGMGVGSDPIIKGGIIYNAKDFRDEHDLPTIFNPTPVIIRSVHTEQSISNLYNIIDSRDTYMLLTTSDNKCERSSLHNNILMDKIMDIYPNILKNMAICNIRDSYLPIDCAFCATRHKHSCFTIKDDHGRGNRRRPQHAIYHIQNWLLDHRISGKELFASCKKRENYNDRPFYIPKSPIIDTVPDLIRDEKHFADEDGDVYIIEDDGEPNQFEELDYDTDQGYVEFGDSKLFEESDYDSDISG
jgi:hypothetical protein